MALGTLITSLASIRKKVEYTEEMNLNIEKLTETLDKVGSRQEVIIELMKQHMTDSFMAGRNR